MRIFSLLLLAALSSLPAAILSSSTGGQMAGGKVTVTWQDNTTSNFLIPVPGVGFEDSAILSQPGFFSFRQDNDTLTNNLNWRLTNSRSGFSIKGFEIDLTNAITAGGTAVFDSGVAPLAPGSNTNVPSFYGGTNGVRSATGELIGISSFSFTSQYTGDGGSNMFRVLTLALASNLAFNNTYQFNADTDQVTGVPEPATWLPLAIFSLVGIARLRLR